MLGPPPNSYGVRRPERDDDSTVHPREEGVSAAGVLAAGNLLGCEPGRHENQRQGQDGEGHVGSGLWAMGDTLEVQTEDNSRPATRRRGRDGRG
jgi:hypothetical protein